MYSKRKFGQHYQAYLKRLSVELLVAKKKAQETFLCSVLQSKGRCWTKFYKYIKQHKGNRGNIPAIKAYNGRLITDPIENVNSLHPYYVSLFSCEHNTPQIESA